MAVDYSIQGAVSAWPANETKAIDTASFSADGTEAEFISQIYSITDGAVDQAISLGLLASAALLYITSDQDVTFKLNGSSVAIRARVLVLQATAITNLAVSNSSGASATIRVVAAGS